MPARTVCRPHDRCQFLSLDFSVAYWQRRGEWKMDENNAERQKRNDGDRRGIPCISSSGNVLTMPQDSFIVNAIPANTANVPKAKPSNNMTLLFHLVSISDSLLTI